MSGETEALLNLAASWRKENPLAIGAVGKGVVVIFEGEVAGWVDEVRNPEAWRPGCVAIGPDGRYRYVAVGGNDYDGAREWAGVCRRCNDRIFAELDETFHTFGLCTDCCDDVTKEVSHAG